jgi:hypothetical protein
MDFFLSNPKVHCFINPTPNDNNITKLMSKILQLAYNNVNFSDDACFSKF